MPTDVELTDPKLSIFVPVPRAADDGVCNICHGPTLERPSGGYWPNCWNCRSIPAGGVRTVAPISLVHTSESQLYASLRDYKSGAIPTSVRDQHALLLAATLQRFLRLHRSHVEAAGGAAWDTIQVVPSTRERQGPHPLVAVIEKTGFRSELRDFITPTGEAVDHNQPNAAAFSVVEEAFARNILLVDDTLTTGARIQSAAAALSASGASVVAAVPIGRVVDTAHITKQEFWRRQRAIEFSFAACCLE